MSKRLNQPWRTNRESACLERMRADFGTRQQTLEIEAARAASHELKERLDKAIFKFGWRHGITTDEARHLLLNTGVRL